METQVWKKCNSCKADIPFGGKYYSCSVSTCNQKPFNYAFCSVSCFERHLPGARHKDAAAINEVAPKFQASPIQAAADSSPTRRIVSSPSNLSKPSPSGSSLPKDTLIVVSKLKDYVKAVADMNTSGDVPEILSDIVRRECDKALNNARRDGRKTLMRRDFEST